jgi:hypothetical protein
MTAAQDLQFSSQAACLRAVSQRASIKVGFRCGADSSSLLPHVCLYVSDIGANRIIFNFTNHASSTYAINSINYHDDGLLGAAVKLGHITGSDTQSINRDVRILTPSDKPDLGDLLSVTDLDGSAPDHGGPGLFIYGGDESESVVNIFDLQNDKGFSDIIFALTEGSLWITLQILELETDCHRHCINDALTMIA